MGLRQVSPSYPAKTLPSEPVFTLFWPMKVLPSSVPEGLEKSLMTKVLSIYRNTLDAMASSCRGDVAEVYAWHDIGARWVEMAKDIREVEHWICSQRYATTRLTPLRLTR